MGPGFIVRKESSDSIWLPQFSFETNPSQSETKVLAGLVG